MQETQYKCDICRKSNPKENMNEVRISDKMHDLCKDCSKKLELVLRGTGRVVQDAPDWQKILEANKQIGSNQLPAGWQGWQNQNQPVVLPSITTTTPVPNNSPYVVVDMGDGVASPNGDNIPGIYSTTVMGLVGTTIASGEAIYSSSLSGAMNSGGLKFDASGRLDSSVAKVMSNSLFASAMPYNTVDPKWK